MSGAVIAGKGKKDYRVNLILASVPLKTQNTAILQDICSMASLAGYIEKCGVSDSCRREKSFNKVLSKSN